MSENANYFLGKKDVHGARAMPLCNDAAFDSISAVPAYRQVAEAAARNGKGAREQQCFREVVEGILRSATGGTVYLGTITVSQATTAMGSRPEGGSTSATHEPCVRKAAAAFAAMVGSQQCIGSSGLQCLLTARLLGAEPMKRWVHRVEEAWTSFSGKYASRIHTVQTLARHWREWFASRKRNFQEEELAVQEAFEHIAKNCRHIRPVLWSASRIERALCEERKFKGQSTPARKT